MQIFDEKADLFGAFLSQITDESRKDDVLEFVDDVLNGRIEQNWFCFEVYCIEVTKDKTYIYSSNLPGIEDDFSEDRYIETSAVPELVNIWWERYSLEKARKRL
ncbi:MAG: hypothetical protein N2691_00780 [Patescibacteria group bacterium]|nr:hypothetical protein [Patescibacteria group bacterium]